MDIRHYISRSRAYSILQKYTGFSFSLFYKEIIVEGLENIPDKSPIIFAPNHQNALMDALAIIVNTPKQLLFMARADMFKNNNARKFLNFIKIIPVYRIRDGVKTLSQNDESFNISVQCLLSGNSIGIMPEGNHGEQKQLRLLKKGISRIAFKAQEKTDSNTCIYIVPVGIDVSHYQNFRSNIKITFGKPINIRDYWDTYSENQQKAFSDLRTDLATELKKLMIDIDSEEYYELISNCSDISWHTVKENLKLDNTYKGNYMSRKLITDALSKWFTENPDMAGEMQKLISEFNALLSRLNLNNQIIEEKNPQLNIIWDIIRYIFYFPFATAGALFNIIPAIATNYFSGKIKDPQFISTVKFVLGMILFPLYYLLFILGPLPLISKVLLVLIMPVLGILAYDYFTGLFVFIKTIRFKIALNQNDTTISRLIYLRTQIINRITNHLFPPK
jgi:1-acyl-sn-glycerol-3-phosphate acyltransferase